MGTQCLKNSKKSNRVIVNKVKVMKKFIENEKVEAIGITFGTFGMMIASWIAII